MRSSIVHRCLCLLAVAGSIEACSEEKIIDPPVFTVIGGEYIIEAQIDGAGLRLLRGTDVLLTLGPDAFELGLVRQLDNAMSYDPFWLENRDGPLAVEPPDDLVWTKLEKMSATHFSNDAASFELTFAQGAKASLEIKADGDGRFSFLWKPVEVPAGAIAYMRLRAHADTEEGFYGLGEWMDHVNHRGQLRPMQLTADIRYEGASLENHVQVPLLVGTRAWGVFVESVRLGLFDVARKADDLIEVTYGTAESSLSEGLRFHLFAAEHPLDITHRYYETTVAPKLPARWAYGPLIWRNDNLDQAEVEDDIRKIRDLDLATTAIWIDRPYATDVNTFDFDPAKYTDAQAMIDMAHAYGLRMAVWHTPYVVEAATELYQEAKMKGYFPPKPGTRINTWSDPIDFTNPEAKTWWQGLLQRYRDMGIEGYKLDFAEDVSIAGLSGARAPWKFFDGSDERTMHYGYTLLYHQTYAETLGSDGGFMLCRAGKWGDQKYATVIWPGDLDADFFEFGEPKEGGGFHSGGLPASVIAGLSLGPSGFPFFASDTGGYIHSPPDEEVFVRWFQQTALSASMEVGDSSSQPPWVYTPENGRDDDTLALYREFARLHLRLFPYVWSYAERLAIDGRPITRALGLAHPELGTHPDDSYLVGDDLLVAPVVRRGATSRDVSFPEGDWIHWFTDASHAGGTISTVDAPLDSLPLFVRAGAIIPMLRPTIDTLSPTTEPTELVDSYATTPGRLYARTSPGPERRFELFDGGALTQGPVGDQIELSFEPGDELRFGVEIEVIGLSTKPTAVATLDEQTSREALDAAESGWWWDGQHAHVRFTDGTVRLSL